MALEHLAELFQLAAVEVDDLSRRIVGFVFCDHELHAEGFGQESEIDGVIVFVFFETSAGVEGQSLFLGISVFADMHVADRAANVERFVLSGVLRERGEG